MSECKCNKPWAEYKDKGCMGCYLVKAEQLEKKVEELEVYKNKNNYTIPEEVIEFINNTPELQSFLWDVDLCPEQCKTDGAKHGLRAVYLLYKFLKGEGE